MYNLTSKEIKKKNLSLMKSRKITPKYSKKQFVT